MENGPLHVSLQAVATRAGVSAMTVSRVLRQAPNVSPATRRKVLLAAEALGHQPDPHLARLMTLVRSRKATRQRATLAVVREAAPEGDLAQSLYQYTTLADLRARAEQHGYATEEFWLGRDGLTADRLTVILRARGIEGVLLSPQTTHMPLQGLDFARLATATLGYGLRDLPLHRAAGNMTLGVQLATNALAARGYQRIGLAITPWFDLRSEHAFSGAMLRYQQTVPARQRVPLLVFPGNDLRRCGDCFRAWLRAHRPDALISFDQHVPGWVRDCGLRIPEDLGFVVHDWTPRMTAFAGISHRRPHVAAAAIDLLATQLLQHERGLPEVPRQVLIPPAWIEGPSLRPPATA